MAESDGQERTEQPTQRKIDQAREKGQIPRSKELGTATILFVAVASLFLVGDEIANAMFSIFKNNYVMTRAEVFDEETTKLTLAKVLPVIGLPMLLLFFFVMIAALVGNILLGGIKVSAKAAMPKASKLNPLKGLKRMFGIQGLMELVKAVAKVLTIGFFLAILLYFRFTEILSISSLPLHQAVEKAFDILLWMLLMLCCSLIPIVLIDVPFQMWNYTRQLRMTKQEIKDEYKDTEGKPEVKTQIRRRQMEMANRRMMAEVPKADVVITNPSHYSVALKYDMQTQGAAPMVIAKGVDQVALKIREIAREYEVPVMRSPALTRAIYHSTELNQTIPEGLFMAVAQILAYVYQLNRFRKGRGARPKPLPEELPIPKEYYKEG
ncbi:flagellar biosynthesis protein FlhB [Dongshaea marina]|uniref:flagellar biosynthesis protein FlhB n=1 Tax=Dongshaea marina TaxID=2047966 RepID=UPI000D3ECD98|nr:flagellar biosynthesis protein FlhB [Dongshaea marina]